MIAQLFSCFLGPTCSLFFLFLESIVYPSTHSNSCLFWYFSRRRRHRRRRWVELSFRRCVAVGVYANQPPHP
ncbi:hypothetical protein QBC41DRAFT_329412 [Cercophora samala]|uniref:Secreted protein n=1 Tax=Cercophora samala TaxID=330535 RepID=A0AA39Z302_9PEZI|nr:hypothetical protein QBC41DRAFT_329412 [Cercophora samala]